MKNNGENRIPTVSHVGDDTLVELVYDREKRTTALAVSRFGGLWNIEQEVRVGTGTILVPYSPNNNLIANECVLLPSTPVEYGLREELVADIQAFVHRYVDLSPEFEAAVACYVLLSWVYDAFSDLPYLRFLGDFGTGKTRGLVVIGSLCYKPFFASGASTVSPIFHILDAFGGTLVLDEADMPFSDAKAELVKILNNGTTAGMPVLRTLTNRHRELNPCAFKVFGPKLIAARESFQDPALESRLLTERTGGRTMRADIPIHLPQTFREEALALRNRLLHFRFCEYFTVKAKGTSALVETGDARLKQIAGALLSVSDDGMRRHIEALLKAHDADALGDRRDSLEGNVLHAVVQALAEDAGSNATVRAIADRFNAEHCADYGGPVSNRWVGFILRQRLGLKTRKSRGTYVVPAEERPRVLAMAQRYGIEVRDTRNT